MKTSSERGTILIMVAVALLVLLMFASFAVDYGMLYAARAQIQTSADAAALAGANSLAFDNTTTANVKARAQAVGRANQVWLEAPDIQTTDVQIVNCPPSTAALPATTTPECVKVNAYRTNRYGRANGMPTWFAWLAGVPDQGVVATATARPVSANGASCMRPWAVADKWFDTQAGGWSQTATWDPSAGDYYTPPTPTDPGTGFTAKNAAGQPTYYGYQMVLKIDNPGQGGGNGNNAQPVYSGGWAMELDLANPTTSGSQPAYIANITGCTSDTVAIAAPGSDCTVVDPSHGCLGVKTGSGGSTNARAIDDFIATHDPGATWVQTATGPTAWQTGTINTTMTTSSRIVPVAIFDMPQYLGHGYSGQNGIVRVVNIMGFFIQGSCSDTNYTKESYLQCPTGGSAQGAIVGRMVNYPGVLAPTGSSVAGGFGDFLVLVR